MVEDRRVSTEPHPVPGAADRGARQQTTVDRPPARGHDMVRPTPAGQPVPSSASSTADRTCVEPPIAGGSGPIELTLLGGFELRRSGRSIEVPQPSQRLIAFLAVQGQAVQRAFVAGSLWPDTSDARAAGSLRSALWRIRDFEPPIVDSVGGRIRLHRSVRVDVLGLAEQAGDMAERSIDELLALARRYEAELLVDRYDEWLDGWRERWRQVRIHALEDVARQLVKAGSCGRAIAVGLSAVDAEPLRESAHRILIEAHLAEGNATEAIRQYRTYERVVRDELGIVPSPRISALVAQVIG
jgi:DNA-binding SARP family transcriptional activator